MLRDTILCVVFVNGVYDVLCFLGIMLSLPLIGSLHTGVFKPEELSPLLRRILAYWILTYGVIRILPVSGDECITAAAALTYFIETFAFECENLAHGSVIRYKVHVAGEYCRPHTATKKRYDEGKNSSLKPSSSTVESTNWMWCGTATPVLAMTLRAKVMRAVLEKKRE